MKMDMTVKGMGKAKHILAASAMFDAAYRGVEMRAAARKGPGESGTNADVKQGLADGGRDIGPNDEDGKKAAEAYVAIKESFLRMQSEKKPPSRASVNQQAMKAWRAAGDAVNKNTLKRIEASKDKDGSVIEVSPEYAKARAAARSMPDDQSIVYRDSGQLIADHANRGGLQVIKK